MVDDLTEMIESNPDPRELKRALAVQMFLAGMKHREIQAILSVSSGFISKWTQLYELGGVPLLKLGHRGSTGYLTAAQREQVIGWIKTQQYWHLPELQAHLENEYDVVFQSKQSYYDLFTAAGLSWKKSQKRNPKADPELVEKKTTELSEWLEARRSKIESLWVHSPPLGAKYQPGLAPWVHTFDSPPLGAKYQPGLAPWVHTFDYLTYLIELFPQSQIAVIWDGASYHRSEVVKTLLGSVNQDLAEEDWKITCLPFAPNDPTQNPIEDIWLQAKRWLRECYHQCQNFAAVRVLFELSTHYQIFDFPKLNRLDEFSLIN
jgi:putative transposase